MDIVKELTRLHGLAGETTLLNFRALMQNELRKLIEQAQDEAAQQCVKRTGGTHSQLVSMVNSLANIIIEASGKDGYISSNNLDYANDCLDKVIPLLKPTSR